jgi:transketolase
MNFLSKLIAAKLKLLEVHFNTQTGHIGSNLSCIDFLMSLYHLKKKNNDKFVLSKGHSSLAFYTTLWSIGLISESDLNTYAQDGTRFPAHPSGNSIPEVIFPTGSLGHGPSLSAGMALSLLKTTDSHVYCLCSDGEWQEGSCWEALIFAVHHKLSNLTIIIDQNKLQGFGDTDSIISCPSLERRIAAFGAAVQIVNGHDPSAILQAMNSGSIELPNFLILETIKGKGMHNENTIECHYLPLTNEQYLHARTSILNN